MECYEDVGIVEISLNYNYDEKYVLDSYLTCLIA
jgi:hypothetical protein